MQIDRHALVVIVGAGPTGLALAIELGMRSIPCLVLERDTHRGASPRAKTTHVRTREIMRRWGIADDLAKASPFGIDYPSHIHFVTRLKGERLVRFDDALHCSPEKDERYSEHGQWVPQYKLEAVLREKVASLESITVRYGAELIDFEQDEDGIRLCIRTVATSEEEWVDAAYLIGADGARSTVRDKIGATMIGRYGLSRNYNIIFRAPGLGEAHTHGPGIMYWHINPEIPSVIGPMDAGLWYFAPTDLAPDTLYSDEEAVRLIKCATGFDLPYEIVSSEIWIASRLLADKYRDRRVFLAGDACHLHPPFGGFGMNMGVADAVDLGWKIAAVLQGWGGTALFDSYEAERRPVHELVMDEAENNHAVLPNQLLRQGIEDQTAEGERIRREVATLISDAKRREFYTLGVILGLRYRNSPIIPSDGTEDSWAMSRDYTPSAAPGSLAPHAWLEDGSSLYDHFGDGFTLLAFDGAAQDDILRARHEADRAAIPLDLVSLADPRLAKLYEAPLALIRPDQVVAWRGHAWPDINLLNIVAGRNGTGGTKITIDGPLCGDQLSFNNLRS